MLMRRWLKVTVAVISCLNTLYYFMQFYKNPKSDIHRDFRFVRTNIYSETSYSEAKPSEVTKGNEYFYQKKGEPETKIGK